ncbi:MAG: hypothetical protein ACRD6I_07705 [Candidatus Acidiferrales bacterium]
MNPSGSAQVIGAQVDPGATSAEFFLLAGGIHQQPVTVVVTAASMFRAPHPVVQVTTNFTIQPLVPTIVFDRAEATDGDFIFAMITFNDNEGAFIGLETSPPGILVTIGSENNVFAIDGSGGTVLFQVGEVEQPTPVTVTAVVTNSPFFGQRGATGSATVTVCPPAGCSPPEPTLRLRAAIGNGSLEPAQGVSSPQGAPATAHFPLGSSFRIAAFDENGNAVNSAFSLQAAIVEAGVEPGALFPDVVALQYTASQPNEAGFQAVHRGTVALSIVPADPNIAPALLNIVVENPQSLGTANPQFDSIIHDISHSRGVPPQYIKAIAHHESGGTFNGLSYRYEPIGPSTGDLDVISRGLDLRLQAPYRDYRIATADFYGPSDPPLSQGPDILPDDINPRSLYFITRPDCQIPGSVLIVRRQIRPCDAFVGADEVYFDNPRQNWSQGSRARQVQTNPTLLNFTAQTGLASSYGLMQVMYVTAIGRLKWAGITGNVQFPAGLKNPSFLFTSPAITKTHASSSGALRSNASSRRSPNVKKRWTHYTSWSRFSVELHTCDRSHWFSE